MTNKKGPRSGLFGSVDLSLTLPDRHRRRQRRHGDGRTDIAVGGGAAAAGPPGAGAADAVAVPGGGPPGITTTRVPTLTRSTGPRRRRSACDAARGDELADRRGLVGAVDAIDGGAEIHRARAEGIAGARHEARQIGLALDHLGRRMPIRPFGLARIFCTPVQVNPTRPTRRRSGSRGRRPARKEVGVRGIDDQRARGLLGDEGDFLRRRFGGSCAGATSGCSSGGNADSTSGLPSGLSLTLRRRYRAGDAGRATDGARRTQRVIAARKVGCGETGGPNRSPPAGGRPAIAWIVGDSTGPAGAPRSE